MNLRLGCLQGRLSPPIDNKVQEFPFDTWREEFKLLEKLNLNHIEWIVTKNSFDNNLLFIEDLTKYPISSICSDHLIDGCIIFGWFLEKYLDPVCEAAIKNNIKNITIPLLEQSNMENDNERKSFCNIIKKYGEKYKELNFTFEMELSPLKQLEIVNLSDNFYITYDTGNQNFCGYDHKYSLYHLHNKINNVHLKDRDFSGLSLPPGKGDTDFELIFQLLKEYKYDGYYTLQTARNTKKEGSEFEIIKKYKEYFLGIFDKVNEKETR